MTVRHLGAIAIFLMGFSLLGSNCASLDGSNAKAESSKEQQNKLENAATRADPVQPDAPEGKAIGTFAGGCFWCVEAAFEKLDGVEEAISGYCGGQSKNPTYKEVSSGETAHTETVRVIYDPEKITYGDLLHKYWRIIDPTQENGQFVDIGSQYRPVIFYHDDRQKRLAQKSKEKLAKNGPFDEPIVVDIKPAAKFWKAEDYHQDYYKKKPERYSNYRNGSGRNEFQEKYWGDDK